MPRLPRFTEHRYVGDRDEMRFYDCDDDGQFQRLAERCEAADLMSEKLLQAFGPDEPHEARNRGFRPAG